MEREELERMRRREDHYWWFVGRRAIVSSILRRWAPPGRPRRLLDVAAGTGGSIAALRPFGEVTVVDLSPYALGQCRERGVEDAICARAEALGIASARFDVATCLDLLEHLDDDVAGARELLRVLRPGGLALLTVPAYRWLWSEHDEALSHRRRYVLPELRRVLERAGFEVPYETYCITTMFPIIAGFRILQRLARLCRPRPPAQTDFVEVAPWLTRLFERLLRGEARYLGRRRRARFRFGVSCLAVARRPRA
jgi:ubiquinone/menaquinone biosynthesis C-methylase UbiE